ncbi:MAG: spinster family MFS transporter [Rhizobiaceae bacterium]
MAGGRQASNAWRVLTVLFLANLFNFFDRAVPAIVIEPIRMEWGLSDLQIGMISAAFTVVYAVAGIPLGRLADTGSRKRVMGWGLIVWSAFTALGAASWNFISFLATRIGVGIGEASYAPAANSLIGDLFPANKRSRATGVFMLGLPLGLLLAFFTVGAMVKAFGSWKAPFVIAMLPGLAIAIAVFMIREPERGAAEVVQTDQTPIANPIRSVLSISTMWLVVIAGIAANFAAYAVNSFMVPLMQRFFGLPLERAAIATGVIVGITGLIGLVAGGWVADRVHERSQRGRLMLGAGSLAGAALATWYALSFSAEQVGAFIALFSIGWLLQYMFYVCLYPAIQDVVEPRLRATAVAIFFAALYLLGGAFGPMVVGYFSDRYAEAAMAAAGATAMTEQFKAIGLHDALGLVPISLLITAIAFLAATRTFPADARAMSERLARSGTVRQPA